MLSGDTQVRPFGGQWGDEGASVSLALQRLVVIVGQMGKESGGITV